MLRVCRGGVKQMGRSWDGEGLVQETVEEWVSVLMTYLLSICSVHSDHDRVDDGEGKD